MVRTTLGLFLIVLTCIQGGCERQGSAVRASERSGWRASVMEARAEKDRHFAGSATSPMAAVDWFELIGSGPHGIHVDELGVSHGPASEAEYRIVQDESNSWIMEGTDGNSRPMPFGEPVATGDRYVLVIYGIDGGILVRVFDQQRPAFTGFDSLRYYDPDPDYTVHARVERLESPQELDMTTSRNRIKTYFRVARLHFSLHGEEQVLTAYKMSLDGPYSDMFFVPFRDATSGEETYGAGRFLELDEPEGDSMVLDFNRAFNPLCNYSPAYNCPLPPAENTLRIPVKAGERTYPLKDHE